MKQLTLIATLALVISACDGTTLTAVDDVSEFSDTAVLAAKPAKLSIDEVSSSGWSGTASYSRSSKGSLKFRMTADGEPNVTITLCIVPTAGGSTCYAVQTDKRGKASLSSQVNYASHMEGTFQIRSGNQATLYAESVSVTFP